MARFKPIHKGLKLLPVDFDRQVIPGSFEYALCHLVDRELDLSAFHARYRNDLEGASAFAPAVLIKIILLAYSRCIIHSRKIADASENHVDLMKKKIDSDTGREMITRRFATVEPVFGNLRGNKRLHRFTLRGKANVYGQWKLYCMMHNIEKLANHGYAR